jgi:uncharacterized protein YhaN
VIITELDVEGFGLWNGLKLSPLGEGLNVVHGPNEAGKTTLLQFIRGTLYGFGPARRRRYLDAVIGGRPGGSLGLRSGGGAYRIARRAHRTENASWGDVATLTAPDGNMYDGSLVAGLLCNIDEPVFTNVFAVGLRELQELATLSDTDAARLLYDLTTGLDRVSLAEVVRELSASRRRLVAPEGETSEIDRLLAERAKAQADLAAAADRMREYARLSREHEAVERDIARWEEERGEAERELRLVEAANQAREKWTERDALDLELEALGPEREWQADALERLDALTRQMQITRKRGRILTKRRRALRKEIAALGPGTDLWRQAPRIAAVLDQQEWIATLERKVKELDAEIALAQGDLSADDDEGSEAVANTKKLPPLGAKELARLRTLAGAVSSARRRAEETRQELERRHDDATQIEEQALSALADMPDKDLAKAIEIAGTHVAGFRRRLQVETRLEQLTRQELELEGRTNELIDRQLLPVWTLAGLGGLFVCGVLMILAGFFLPESIVGTTGGWGMAFLGVAGVVAAAMGKRSMEQAAEKQLATCEKQVETLHVQMRQAKKERDELDEQLPKGGGPTEARLAAAEKKLAQLEGIIPLESQRKVVSQGAASVKQRAKEAHRRLIEARRAWSDALSEAGWPSNLSPKQVLLSNRGSKRSQTISKKIAFLKLEREQAQRSLRTMLERVREVAADCGVPGDAANAMEQLRRLRQEINQQEAASTQRRTLEDKAHKYLRIGKRLRRDFSRLKTKQTKLIRSVGARDEIEFRRFAADDARAKELRATRVTVQAALTKALGPHITEDDVRPLLTAEQAVRLEGRWEHLAAQVQAREGDLRGAFERRGQLSQAQQTLAADRAAATRKLDITMIDQRLKAAADRWRVVSVTGMVLESVRRGYERERQPETLRDASRYLAAMTTGQYRRVWTPLDENLLCVDHADGRSLPVEALSRGTREQLFLALRLALVAAYARRGVELPLVLDDVFVNFDHDRARAAANVLSDFADTGRQVFVFTCHEHIVKLFKAKKTTVIRLPERGAEAPAVTLEVESRKKPKREEPVEEPPLEVVEEPVLAVPPPPEPEPEPLPVFEEPIVEVAVSSVPASKVEVIAPPIILPWPLDTQLLEEETPSEDDWDGRDDSEAPAELAVPWFEDTWHDESEAPDDSAGEREDDAWRWPPEPEPAPVKVVAVAPPPVHAPLPPPPPRPTRRVTHRWLYRGMFDGHGAEEFPGEFAERAGPGKFEELDWDERPVSAIDPWEAADVLREAQAFTWGRVSAVDHHDGDYPPPRPADIARVASPVVAQRATWEEAAESYAPPTYTPRPYSPPSHTPPAYRASDSDATYAPPPHRNGSTNGSTNGAAGHHASGDDHAHDDEYADDDEYAAPRLNLREALDASRDVSAGYAWPRPPHYLGAVHDA